MAQPRPIAYGGIMDTRRTRTGGWRAVTAVVALYAFVLQAFLGGLAPLPAHAGVLCLGQSDAGAPGGGGPDDAGAVHHHACCTAASVAGGGEQPLPCVTAILWPPRVAARVAWRGETAVAARGPPGSIAHPRGPPSV